MRLHKRKGSKTKELDAWSITPSVAWCSDDGQQKVLLRTPTDPTVCVHKLCEPHQPTLHNPQMEGVMCEGGGLGAALGNFDGLTEPNRTEPNSSSLTARVALARGVPIHSERVTPCSRVQEKLPSTQVSSGGVANCRWAVKASSPQPKPHLANDCDLPTSSPHNHNRPARRASHAHKRPALTSFAHRSQAFKTRAMAHQNLAS
jgi:hypothetical protein